MPDEIPPTKTLLPQATGDGAAAQLPPTLPADGGASATPGRLGDFELEGELARGGMGVVYKARQLSLNRRVALKMILAGRFANSAAAQRFRVEAEAAAALDHPNIVPIYEIGTADGLTYFTMKLIEGETLAARLAAAPLAQRKGDTLRGLVEILLNVTQAVEFAHRRGVIHRDLKPANILLEGGQTPYVADFGLAKRAPGELGASATGGAAADGLTASGAVLGTPNYMAPEQARGAKETTTQTDVYGLGAILYEILCGKPPFAGANYIETLLKVQNEEPSAPSAANPHVDPNLAAICLKCLKKAPSERYATADALAADLRAWLAGEPISVRPPGLATLARQWMRRNLKDAFWVVFVGAFCGFFVGAIVSAFSMAYLFERVLNAYGEFPSQQPAAWVAPALWLSGVLTYLNAPLMMVVASILSGGMGLFLSWFVDLRTPRRALAHGLGMSLVVGLVTAYCVLPATILATIVVPDLAERSEVVDAVFNPDAKDGADQLPRAKLLARYPELKDLSPEERAKRYFRFTVARHVIGAFEGAWYGLTTCLVVIPFGGIVQTLVAGFVVRNVQRQLVRIVAYALLLTTLGLGIGFGAYLGYKLLFWTSDVRWGVEDLVYVAQAILALGVFVLLARAIKAHRPFLYYVWLCGGGFCLNGMLNLALGAHTWGHGIAEAVALPVLGSLALACFFMLRRYWRSSPPAPGG